MLVPDFPARCRSPRRAENSGSVSSSNSTAALLSGLSPDLAKETKQARPSQRQSFPLYINSGSATDRFRTDPQLILQWEAHTFGGILRTARTGECETSNSCHILSQTIPQTDHSIASAQPRPRLLADFPKRVEVSKPFLFSFRSLNNSAALALILRERTLPVRLRQQRGTLHRILMSLSARMFVPLSSRLKLRCNDVQWTIFSIHRTMPNAPAEGCDVDFFGVFRVRNDRCPHLKLKPVCATSFPRSLDFHGRTRTGA